MIKFRYKRKEPTNTVGSSNNNTLPRNNKSGEIKSNDSKDDIKANAPKCEINDIKSTPQMIKTLKTNATEQEQYKENCIRAIVVSA